MPNAKKNTARMARYHESRRIGRCDRCSKPTDRPNRAMCGECAKKHQRVSDEARWVSMGVQFTYADYDRLFEQQQGHCAIYQQPSRRRLHRDHDHQTLVVRGLLCGKCNKGLGLFGDSVETLQQAAFYIAKQE